MHYSLSPKLDHIVNDPKPVTDETFKPLSNRFLSRKAPLSTQALDHIAHHIDYVDSMFDRLGPNDDDIHAYHVAYLDKLRNRLQNSISTIEAKQIAQSDPTVKKSDLSKGSAQRRMPFDPNEDVTHASRHSTQQWQFERDQRHRALIPRMEGAARSRALHKLSGATKTKLEGGKRLFLLHRGMGLEEHNTTVYAAPGFKGGAAMAQRVSPASPTSWTPREDLANNFANPYTHKPGKMVSAWVHEDDIHSIPKQFGDPMSVPTKSKNFLHNEHEVIVRPKHGSVVEQVKDPIRPEDRPPNTELHHRINTRGEREVKGQKLYGQLIQ